MSITNDKRCGSCNGLGTRYPEDPCGSTCSRCNGGGTVEGYICDGCGEGLDEERPPGDLDADLLPDYIEDLCGRCESIGMGDTESMTDDEREWFETTAKCREEDKGEDLLSITDDGKTMIIHGEDD